MGILSWLCKGRVDPRKEASGCEECVTKVQAIREEHQRQRARIDQMQNDLETATMNGEERWFLKLEKAKEGHQHG